MLPIVLIYTLNYYGTMLFKQNLNITLLYISLSLLFACKNKTEITGKNTAKPEGSKKSLAEEIFKGNQLLNSANNAGRKKQIYDSLKIATKENNFAYAISSNLRQKDAVEIYKKLVASGLSSLYIFRSDKKENYIVQYEGKGDGELELNMTVLKYQLGEFKNDDLKIINLTDEEYCGKNKTIGKLTENEDGIEIKYIVCQ